jgi:hypothetical protein
MLLEEFLVPGKMTQAALAQKLGWTRARVNKLIKGKRDMSGGLRSGYGPVLDCETLDESPNNVQSTRPCGGERPSKI